MKFSPETAVPVAAGMQETERWLDAVAKATKEGWESGWVLGKLFSASMRDLWGCSL